MENALDSYVIQGVQHNIPLLRDIIRQPRFIAGDTSTNFLPEVYPNRFEVRPKKSSPPLQLVSGFPRVDAHSTRFYKKRRHLS
jgi:propionyl-CoA carboxylase alpha chain